MPLLADRGGRRQQTGLMGPRGQVTSCNGCMLVPACLTGLKTAPSGTELPQTPGQAAERHNQECRLRAARQRDTESLSELHSPVLPAITLRQEECRNSQSWQNDMP